MESQTAANLTYVVISLLIFMLTFYIAMTVTEKKFLFVSSVCSLVSVISFFALLYFLFQTLFS